MTAKSVLFCSQDLCPRARAPTCPPLLPTADPTVHSSAIYDYAKMAKWFFTLLTSQTGTEYTSPFFLIKYTVGLY